MTTTTPSITAATFDPASYMRSACGEGMVWRYTPGGPVTAVLVMAGDPDYEFARSLTYVPAPKGHPEHRTVNYVPAEVASLAIECAECGAEPGQPCEWSCTAHPDAIDDRLMVEADGTVAEDADNTPVLVRAVVTTPEGQTYVTYGGEVPAWLWDDPEARAMWKRQHRAYVLSSFHPKPTHARGFRVEWEGWVKDEEAQK